MIAVLITFVFLLNVIPAEASGSGMGKPVTADIPKRSISLSGEVDIYDGADAVVYGKTFGDAGHRLGVYTYIDDINGDEYNDLCMVSQEDYSDHGVKGDGRVYIFLGDGD
jgi:hypothetical protein